jgi:hypothetical protein
MKLTKIVLALGLVLSLCAPALADGAQCTPTYPRGFKVLKGTKKKPVRLCVGGDLETTWRKCQERRSA